MSVVDDFWRDACYAARTLRKHPLFAGAAILTLALGIGANTAVFSVVNAIIFRPLPVKDGHLLAVIASVSSSTAALGPVSFSNLQDYRAATHDIFEDIAGYSVGFIGLAREGGRPERVLVTWVTGNYFSLLGVQPALGRLIRTEEGLPGRTDPVVVLGHSTWQRLFGSDPLVVGRKVTLNGQPCAIIGVVPSEFVGTFAFSESGVYLPVNWTGRSVLDDRGARTQHTIARLRAGVTLARSQAALDVIAARLERQHPEENRGIRLKVLPERLARPEEDNARSNTFGATMILSLVVLVLLVAEVNVTNLLLARAAARRKELAIRVAIGASRGRLIRQLLAESAILAFLGGIVGVGLGAWISRLLAMVRLPGDLPVRLDFRLDMRVLAYAAVLSSVTTLVVGLIASRRGSHGNVYEALHDHGWGSSTSVIGGLSVRKALLIAQMAISFVLLIAGGLFLRSLTQAGHARFGFNPDGVLNVQMNVAQVGYAQYEGRAFFDEVQRRVAGVRGVEDVAFAFSVPMGYVRLSSRVEAEDHPASPGERTSSGKNIVGPHYFATMDMAIERGRAFTDADDERSRPVAIVNRRLAQMLWPGQDAIGRRFSQVGPNGPWLEVVGITGTGKYRFLFEDPQPYFYVPLAQEYCALRVLHVRTGLSPEALAPAIEREIHNLESNLPLYDVQSMRKALYGGYGLFAVRSAALFAALLALLGLSLTVVGLYGMASYMTSERTHEIGIRMSLGARPRNIAMMVIREAMSLTVWGTVIGLIGAVGLARVLSRLLFGIAPIDLVSFAGACVCVLLVTLVAMYVPARRAMSVDPVVALRSE